MMSVCRRLAVVATVSTAASSAVANPITATDFSGTSSLSSGVFAFQAFLPVPISGGTLYRDNNLNGFSDFTQSFNYDAPGMGIAGPVCLLYISAGNTTAYHGSGALSTTFDWALTGYDGIVTEGSPLPSVVGSSLFGTATFQGGATILHISESLLWADGLLTGGWGGYKINGITDLVLTAGPGGNYTINTAVPVPSAIVTLVVGGFIGSRRRRRA